MGAGRLVQSVGKVASGAAVGQLFLLLALSLSTALYSPEAIGALGLTASVAAIGEVILGLRLDLALPVVRDEDQFSKLASFVERQARRGLVIAVFPFVIALVWFNAWAEPTPAVVAVSLGSASLALFFDARVLMAIRNRAFSRVGLAQGVSGLTQAVSLVAFGFLSPNPLLAALTFPIARAVSAAIVLSSEVPERASQTPKAREMVAAYPNFARFSMPTGLISSVNLAIPVAFFALIFDVAEAGIFFVVWRLVVGPSQLLGRSIGQVVYGETAAVEQTGAVRSRTLAALKRSVALGVVVLMGAIALSIGGVERLLGNEWSNIRLYLIPVGVIAASQLATSPVRNVLTRLGHQKRLLQVQLVRLATTAAAAAVAVVFEVSEVYATWFIAGAYVAANLLVVQATLDVLGRETAVVTV